MYAATKAGVVSLTASVGLETPSDVRVHAVCPDVVQTAMLHEGHTHDSLGSRLAHSGSRVLEPEEVAREAVGLLGSHRVILSVPRSRGAVVRFSALSPSLSRHAIALVEAKGRRAIAKDAGRAGRG